MLVSKRMLAGVTAAIMLLGIGACSSNTATVGSPANPPQVSVVSVSPAESVKATDISVVESGFSRVGEYWTYAVILENLNDHFAARNISVDLTFRDDAGTVLANTKTFVGYISPLQRAAIASQVIEIGGTPTKLEVRATPSNDNWNPPETSQNSRVDTLYKISNLAEIAEGYNSRSYTGEVENSGTEMLDMISVAIVMRDSAGRIVGGASTFVDNIPAKGKAAFQISVFPPPEHATVEAYAVLPY